MDVKGKKSLSDNPCIGECSTHLGDDICKGCGRTFYEVNNWTRLEINERISINKRLQKCLKK